MSRVKLTKYISQALVEEGVSHVFMVPGGYVDNFVKAIVETPNIKAIVCASEAGAAMMADGFARSSRAIGVCMGISGPGASNMLTGLSMSKADRVPVLAITGDNPLVWRDRDSIQDSARSGLKTLDLLADVSDAQYQFYEASLAGDLVRRSMTHLTSQDAGPVHLSVPMDRQVQEVSYDYAPTNAIGKTSRIVDMAGLDEVYEVIAKSVKVALLVGSGIRKSRAARQLVSFAEQYQIPVATTMSAKGDFPEDHPLSWGVFGWSGSELANETLMDNEIECLIVIGSKLGQIATMCWDDALRSNRKLIQIDSNSRNLNQSYLADLAITSDAAAALDYLSYKKIRSQEQSRHDLVRRREDWIETIGVRRSMQYVPANSFSESLPVHPAFAVSELQRVAPKQVQIFVDNGAHTFFAAHYWQSNEENSFFNAIKYSGAMGWAIPACIGSKFSRPELSAIAIVGDGCMLMHGIEIQTAARYGLKGIVFVVINNCAHGNPKLRLGGVSDEEGEVTNIPDHDWAQFAESLGVKGYTVNQPNELGAVLSESFQQDRPALVDVKCGLYETPTKVFDNSFMKEFNRYINV